MVCYLHHHPMGRIFKKNLKSRFFTVLTLSLMLLVFQGCGEGDVSMALGSEAGIKDDVQDLEGEASEVVEEADPLDDPGEDEPVVPKVTSFEFTPDMAMLSNGATLSGGVVIIPSAGEAITDRGLAEYTFNVEVAGEYIVEANISAPDISSNSYFANMDLEPTADMVWHMLPADGFAIKTLTWGGAPDEQNPEHRFILNEGAHVLKLRGRETNVQLQNLTIKMRP